MSNKPPPNNNEPSPKKKITKASLMNNETESPPLKLFDDAPGDCGTEGDGNGDLPPETLGSGQQPLAPGSALGSTGDSMQTNTTTCTCTRAGGRVITTVLTSSKSPPVATLNSGQQQVIEKKVLSTELSSGTPKHAGGTTKIDSRDVDDRKPAAKESHQVQTDDKNKHDNSKSNDTINMDSASTVLENLEARLNNPQQSGQLKFLPKEKQSHIKGDLGEKIAADSKIPATPSFKGTSHDSSTFAALSSVEDRLNNPGLSFFPSKSSGQHSSGIIPPTEQGQMPITIPVIGANAGTTSGRPSPTLTQQHQQLPQPGAYSNVPGDRPSVV
ncbi:hypothetical protein SEMRO_632_G178710.1 [Seminavis robusta]|uniref:Uncharacterized protein n=1 Tax=Seminavis robusta TaxID=568900 RepID=A0A9N8HKS2_9STRA|nr:hypothetical protein SEMRO_632_G178710.1 [Seminavis robusta]|eukprot:Sro632_g178710.1 n/a (328) ;mRNA; f:43079-44157